MKHIFIILFFISSFISYGETIESIKQETKKNILPFKSKIVTNDLPCKDAIVNIYNAESFNFELDTNTILEIIHLKDDGVLSLNIPRDVCYIVEITKQGFVHKRFKIDTKDIDNKTWELEFKGFVIDTISLFKPVESVNYKVFDYPLVVVEFDYNNSNFYYNENYSSIALTAIDMVKELETDKILLNKNKLDLQESKKAEDKLTTKLFLVSVSSLILILFLIGILFFVTKKNKTNQL